MLVYNVLRRPLGEPHTTYDGGAATASIDVANTRRIARIKGVVRNGPTAGDLKVRAAPEVAATDQLIVKRGSTMTVV